MKMEVLPQLLPNKMPNSLPRPVDALVTRVKGLSCPVVGDHLGTGFFQGEKMPLADFYVAVSIPNTSPDALCRVFLFLNWSGLSAQCPVKHLILGRQALVIPMACLNLVKGKEDGSFFPFVLP